jgi:hypothetical protein
VAEERHCEHGHLVAAGNSFCTQCGAPVLPATCPNGHPLRAASPFCPQCGARVGAQAAHESLAGGAAGQAGDPRFAPLPPAAPTAWDPNPYASGSPSGGAPAPLLPLNALAVASFIASVVWVWWVNAVAAIVLAWLALGQLRTREQRGRGLAIAGIVLSAIELVIGGVVVVATGAGSHHALGAAVTSFVRVVLR